MFVLPKLKHVTTDLIHNAPLMLGIAMFKDVANDIVAVWIRGQFGDAAEDLLQHLFQALWCAVLQQALDDSAPVDVCRHSLCLVLDSLHDKGDRLRWHLFNALLDHVVSMHALDAINHSMPQLSGKHGLEFWWAHLKSLLDDAAAVHLQGQLHNGLPELFHDGSALVWCADVQQLLHNCAAGRVSSKHLHLRKQCIEDLPALGRVGSLQLCLQKAASFRVLCQLGDVGEDVS
mmetsp:Transcript_56983/g.79034  ORF Transcript_56983/g.79034 Transcript_56983/m.79034 type:complete len:232 (-) Transcript_56983:693-1388(-)